MLPHDFIAKWQSSQLSDRSACQQHFLDPCDLLHHPRPADADPTGTWFPFERGVAKGAGGHGWADVWLVESRLDRHAHVTVLDPACGSGNFLYAAIRLLLDLEKEVLTYAADRGLTSGRCNSKPGPSGR